MERIEVVAEWRACRLEPREDAAVALVEDSIGRADLQTRYNLLDKLAFAARRKGCGDFLIIEDSGRNQGLVSAVAIPAQRIEVWQVGDGVNEAADAECAPTKSSANGQQHEQRRGDVHEHQPGLEKDWQCEQCSTTCAEDAVTVKPALARCAGGGCGHAEEEGKKPTQ